MGKLVSIIVPVYKVESYLRICIEGILNQTYGNIEIILVDDGSPDNCPEICDEYVKKDSRIRVIHKENGGLSSARNTGIENAKGEYIAMIDSDDAVHEKFIEILYGLCENSECQVAQCDFLSISADSIKLPPQRHARLQFYTNREAMKKCCGGANAVKYNVVWNKLYHKSVFENIRFPIGKTHEDEFTTYRLLWNIKKMAVINLYLYWYLQRSDSIMGKKSNIHYLDRLEAYKERVRFLKNNNMEDTYEKMLTKYYYSIWNLYDKIKSSKEYDSQTCQKLEYESENVKKEILSLPERRHKDNIPILFPEMRKEEKEEFIFPFGKIKKGSKIALYGAGKVGQTYYRQLSATMYGDIVLWVDNMWQNYLDKPYHVYPLDLLTKYEYDYLVIAIKDFNAANIIRDDIVSWGIPKMKIIWENPEVMPFYR